MPFSPETIDFLWALRFNNNREWFHANKATYEAHLLQPIRELARTVYDRFDAAHPGLQLNLHISRIYRDARRLFGRGPMKDHLWFTLEQPADSGSARPGFYFTIHPDRWGYGMGFFDARAAVMQAYRADIDHAPAKALALADRFAAQDRFVLGGPMYARPKGNPGGLLDVWYNQRIVELAYESSPGDELFSPALADQMFEGFEFLLPYYEWLYGIAVRAEADGRDNG